MAINKNKVIAAAQKYVQKGQLDKAIKEYRRVVEAEPGDVRTWLKIGDLQAKTDAAEQAVEAEADQGSGQAEDEWAKSLASSGRVRVWRATEIR